MLRTPPKRLRKRRSRSSPGLAAIRRAKDHLKGEVPFDSIYVIGDTPRDILCGKEAGARTVAVATGGSDMEELGNYEPDHLFEDFSSTKSVVQIFL